MYTSVKQSIMIERPVPRPGTMSETSRQRLTVREAQSTIDAENSDEKWSKNDASSKSLHAEESN